VPGLRHRDAWAEEARAPTREAWESERRAEKEAEVSNMSEKNVPERKLATRTDAGDLPHDVLVVVSKLKAYVKARSGFNTSDAVVDLLSEHLRRVCDLAIDNASVDGRKTLLDRDFKNLLKTLP
jgi:formylglycine-generating enzyme required for sulfatase activity